MAEFPQGYRTTLMRIRYEVTVEDQVALTIHLQKNSPTLQRTRIGIVIGMAVYLASVSALVIPEHNVLEGDYHSFVEELRNRWQQDRGETALGDDANPRG